MQQTTNVDIDYPKVRGDFAEHVIAAVESPAGEFLLSSVCVIATPAALELITKLQQNPIEIVTRRVMMRLKTSKTVSFLQLFSA